jgi:hypothetical protein
LNYAGVVLAVGTLVLLVLVKPKAAHAAASIDEEVRDSSSINAELLSSGSKDTESGSAPPVASTSQLKLWDRLSPLQRRALGVVLSLTAGLLSGSTFTPPQHVVDRTSDWESNGRAGPAPFPGASTSLMDLIFSHFTGV